MSSAHSFITEAQIDLAFTFILFPICLGSALESIPVGCRPTLHWAFSAEPWTKPCRSKTPSVWPISEKNPACISVSLSPPQKKQNKTKKSYLDFSRCFSECYNKTKSKKSCKIILQLLFWSTNKNNIEIKWSNDELWRHFIKKISDSTCWG